MTYLERNTKGLLYELVLVILRTCVDKTVGLNNRLVQTFNKDTNKLPYSNVPEWESAKDHTATLSVVLPPCYCLSAKGTGVRAHVYNTRTSSALLWDTISSMSFTRKPFFTFVPPYFPNNTHALHCSAWVSFFNGIIWRLFFYKCTSLAHLSCAIGMIYLLILWIVIVVCQYKA